MDVQTIGMIFQERLKTKVKLVKLLWSANRKSLCCINWHNNG